MITLIFDLLISGKLDGVSKKIPFIFRLIFVTVFWGTIASLIIWAGILAMDVSGVGWGIFCWIVAFVVVCVWLFICYRMIKEKLKPQD